MKTLNDKELVEFLRTRLMKDYFGDFDPFGDYELLFGIILFFLFYIEFDKTN